MKAAVAFIVTAGTYSEYRILAVCDNEKEAQDIALAWNQSTEYSHNSMEARVEGWPIGADGFTPGTKLFRAFMTVDSSEVRYLCDDSRPEFDAREPVVVDELGGLKMWVWADDEQHARKIATERWAQWKALKP